MSWNPYWNRYWIGATPADIEQLRKAFFHRRADAIRRLAADGISLLRAFQEQIMSPSPTKPNQLVVAPKFREWWQSKGRPFFDYFSDYSKRVGDPDADFHELQAWIDRMVDLRTQAAQMGIRIPPSTSNLLDYGTSRPQVAAWPYTYVGAPYAYAAHYWYGPAHYGGW